MPGIWDHDLWADIYDIPDPITKNVVIQMYRLILDMRNSDILADAVARKVNTERKFVLSIGAKVWGVVVSLLIATDTIVHILK